MKNIKITLSDLFNLPTASLYNAALYNSASLVSIDSRKAKKGSIFIAIKGEKFDGHDFISDVIKSGVAAIIINEDEVKTNLKHKVTIVAVKDTIKALGDLALIYRNKLSAKVFALTGSNGKTTTKEIVTTLLKEKFSVVSTVSNNNNHIGVPLTIFTANSKTEILVLELGTNHFNEIAYTSAIAKPDYALITNIGASHLEFLKNEKGVLKEKEALFKAAEINNGLILINIDDKNLFPLKKKYSNTLSFGFNNTADVKGLITDVDDTGKYKVQIDYRDKNFSFTSPLFGKSNAANLLAAVAVCLSMELSPREILNGIKKLKPAKQRLDVKKFKNILLVDDTYNANPQSMKSALELLHSVKKYDKKIAILGDMFELGTKSKELHKSLKKEIQQNKIDVVFTIGKQMKYLFDELNKKNIYSVHFADRNSLQTMIKNYDFTKSIVLVKGSRGMKMEEFVKTIEERFSN